MEKLKNVNSDGYYFMYTFFLILLKNNSTVITFGCCFETVWNDIFISFLNAFLIVHIWIFLYNSFLFKNFCFISSKIKYSSWYYSKIFDNYIYCAF